MTHAQMKTLVLSKLHDESAAVYAGTNEVELVIEDALKEIARYRPFYFVETYEIETRSGKATSDTADALVDATESQFLTTDADKVIYNSDDNTWAIVTDAQYAVTDDKLVLSKDIMVDGNENYYIYNKQCRNRRQLYIGDLSTLDTFMGVDYAVYPTQQLTERRRNVYLLDQNKILQMDINEGLLGDSADTDADVEVYVRFRERHRLNPMTDLAGALTASEPAGETSLAVGSLTDADTPVPEGALLSIAGVRGTYHVTADATISSNAATVIVYPGLKDAATSADKVYFVGSTLSGTLEDLLSDLVVARCLLNKGIDYLNNVNKGGPNTPTQFINAGNLLLERVQRHLRRISPAKTYTVYSRG